MSNPIINGFYADPDIAFINGRIYVYPTTDGGVEWNSTYFRAFSSDNMTDWRDEGIILDFADIPWTGGSRAWAPAIAERGGKYYFYYSGNGNIGAAYCDTPTGKFVDIGAPLVAEGSLPGTAIDPDAFVDDDGSAYLYWGNGHMYAAKLGDDMLSVGTPMDITPPNFREGSCVFKRNGVYYFTWCEDDTRSPNYHVRYGKGTSPMQKPVGNTVILSRDNAEDRRIKCTGHHSVLNIPGTDEWYICYHRFNIEKYGDVEDYSTEAGNHRELCIDRMYFDKNGDIIPIKATLNGVDSIKTAQR